MGKTAEKNVAEVRSPSGTFDIMALCALAGAMFLWSGTFIAMKVALEALHPVHIVFTRMAASTVLLLPFMRVWMRRSPYAKGDWRIFLALVLAEPCLYFIFEGYALRYTTASQAGLITALLPLLVGVSAYVVLKERLSGRVWAGFMLAVAGVVILSMTGENSESAPNALLGNGLEFLAMVMACAYTLCARKLKGYHALFITMVQAAAGAVFFAALALGMGLPLPDAGLTREQLWSLVFLSVSTIMAYGLYNLGIARLSAGQAAAWINLIPALTLILGMWLLHERLTFFQSLALLPIFAGLALSQLDKVRVGGQPQAGRQEPGAPLRR